jgi:hypothetical protein
MLVLPLPFRRLICPFHDLLSFLEVQKYNLFYYPQMPMRFFFETVRLQASGRKTGRSGEPKAGSGYHCGIYFTGALFSSSTRKS